MNVIDSAPPRWTETMLSILRVVSALLFMQHGAQKLYGFPPSGTQVPTPELTLLSQMGIAGVLELFGGLFILLGLFTRPIAFLLAGEMAVAYFKSHAPRGFFPIVNRGELAALFCFVFLYFAVAGGGRWSLDALMRRRRRADPAELNA